MRKASCARIRLTWSLPPHSPAGGFAHKSETPHYYPSRFYRQDLHLSRTMLTTPWVAYVDRFACDWHRLSTTDPYRRIIKNNSIHVQFYYYFKNFDYIVKQPNIIFLPNILSHNSQNNENKFCNPYLLMYRKLEQKT